MLLKMFEAGTSPSLIGFSLWKEAQVMQAQYWLIYLVNFYVNTRWQCSILLRIPFFFGLQVKLKAFFLYKGLSHPLYGGKLVFRILFYSFVLLNFRMFF